MALPPILGRRRWTIGVLLGVGILIKGSAALSTAHVKERYHEDTPASLLKEPHRHA